MARSDLRCGVGWTLCPIRLTVDLPRRCVQPDEADAGEPEGTHSGERHSCNPVEPDSLKTPSTSTLRPSPLFGPFLHRLLKQELVRKKFNVGFTVDGLERGNWLYDQMEDKFPETLQEPEYQASDRDTNSS